MNINLIKQYFGKRNLSFISVLLIKFNQLLGLKGERGEKGDKGDIGLEG